MGNLRNWIIVGVGCCALVLATFGNVGAESIEGSVRARANASTEAESSSDGFYWQVWNGALPERRPTDDHNDVLAVLTGRVTGPPIGCRFDFRGGALDPSTVVGRTGSQVKLANRDAFTHEPAVEGLAGFTPLEVGPGKARVISVPPGGPWVLSDRIYGHVEGHLHSMRDLIACAKVTQGGKFRFDGVPPGTYSLRILRGPEQVASRRVTVSAERTLRVDPLTMKKRRGN